MVVAACNLGATCLLHVASNQYRFYIIQAMPEVAVTLKWGISSKRKVRNVSNLLAGIGFEPLTLQAEG
jgi:hypothetical protein